MIEKFSQSKLNSALCVVFVCTSSSVIDKMHLKFCMKEFLLKK